MPTSHDPTSLDLSADSSISLIESAERHLHTLSAISDLLSSIPAEASLAPATLPAIGSFLLEEFKQILSSLESLHTTITKSHSEKTHAHDD